MGRTQRTHMTVQASTQTQQGLESTILRTLRQEESAKKIALTEIRNQAAGASPP